MFTTKTKKALCLSLLVSLTTQISAESWMDTLKSWATPKKVVGIGLGFVAGCYGKYLWDNRIRPVRTITIGTTAHSLLNNELYGRRDNITVRLAINDTFLGGRIIDASTQSEIANFQSDDINVVATPERAITFTQNQYPYPSRRINLLNSHFAQILNGSLDNARELNQIQGARENLNNLMQTLRRAIADEQRNPDINQNGNNDAIQQPPIHHAPSSAAAASSLNY